MLALFSRTEFADLYMNDFTTLEYDRRTMHFTLEELFSDCVMEGG